MEDPAGVVTLNSLEKHDQDALHSALGTASDREASSMTPAPLDAERLAGAVGQIVTVSKVQKGDGSVSLLRVDSSCSSYSAASRPINAWQTVSSSSPVASPILLQGIGAWICRQLESGQAVKKAGEGGLCFLGVGCPQRIVEKKPLLRASLYRLPPQFLLPLMAPDMRIWRDTVMALRKLDSLLGNF
ncbi:hypothetical protein WJX74_010048 [Apatococcus lobatus]|uniref:Uncharacterized protein n=1 Tax=Apatococcus lobatus TaxID=904363 RepID=A0AAW1RST1_9CHLO